MTSVAEVKVPCILNFLDMPLDDGLRFAKLFLMFYMPGLDEGPPGKAGTRVPAKTGAPL